MINKLVIANRGEIACRIIQTAQKLGIKTVALYSDADAQANHVLAADEAYHIGPSPSRESYLVIDKIIEVAKQANADAIHPGYGFLSENEIFADRCEKEGIIFVGPSSAAIIAMGSKSRSKELMAEANVPLVPGYYGENQDPAFLQQEAEKVGYPVLIKAAYGGGGKGMRVVNSAEQFAEELAGAKREATASFGNDKVLIERYVADPRHVEVQIFADSFGNCIYLGDRDCSLQRRHQKVIEEAPAVGLSDELRKEMGEAAVRCAKKINYKGAGTVEFLLCGDEFFFMEMNTRLQVEHPVTEMVTGLDLVEWQLAVASNEPLPLEQEQVVLTGHALEARIYAEQPEQNFIPCSGEISLYKMPEAYQARNNAVRIDTGIRKGSEISSFYDPMIAKLIVHASSRQAALRKLTVALEQTAIAGLHTNVGFLHALATHPTFVAAPPSTNFIDKEIDSLLADSDRDHNTACALAGAAYILSQVIEKQANPWDKLVGFSLNNARHYKLPFVDENLTLTSFCAVNDLFTLELNGTHYQVSASIDGETISATINGVKYIANYLINDNEITLIQLGRSYYFNLANKHYIAAKNDDEGSLTAPLNGTVVKCMVEPNTLVAKGDPVIIIEAMKMEYVLKAPTDGEITQFYYQAGDLVSHGALLAELKVAEHDS